MAHNVTKTHAFHVMKTHQFERHIPVFHHRVHLFGVIHFVLFIYLFVCLFCLFCFVCLFVYSFVCLFVYSFICLFVYLFVCLFVYLFDCLFGYLFDCLFVYSFVCLFLCLFLCLFIYLFICLFILGAVNGRNTNEGGNHNFPGYVPISTQPNVVSGVLTKVALPNGVPYGPYFEFPEQQEYPHYQQY